MSELCNRIAGKFGTSWVYIGWALFLSFLAGLYLAYDWPLYTPFMATVGGLTLLWWLIDVVDQGVPLWMIGVGVLMLGVGFLPRGGLLTIACWVIYWLKVRE